MALLIPTPFLAEDASPDQELTQVIESRRSRLAATIYSILKLHTRDLSESTIDNLAATILDECEKYLLDPVLILGVISVESEFQHKAVSSTGARGLMQILPSVAAPLAEQTGLKEWAGVESLYDPIVNAKIGLLYLSYLKERFNDVSIALAACRWGPTRIQEKLETNRPVPFDYTRKVLSVARAYRDRKAESLIDAASFPRSESIEVG
ncbi:MAG TPA: lytic transglycosylase domain-containing protein [Candidatus Binatia bacterium]|nr:lytic transglycosylase domain-containing protein [Candidatus Binatia bacterium]